MFQAHIPPPFWGEFLLTATYLINRLPSSFLRGVSPFEKLLCKPPILDRLRVFGCRCFATTLGHLDKFSPRTTPSIFMGYPPSQKGYQVYEPVSNSFFVSRDVIFQETIFPFSSSPTSSLSSDSLAMPIIPDMLDPDSYTSSSLLVDLPNPPSPDVPSSTDPVPISNPCLELVPYTQHVTSSIPYNPLPSPGSPASSLHRSNRTTRPAIWTFNYLCPTLSSTSTASLYPISNYVSLNQCKLPYQHLIAFISSITEPTTYHEASQNPHWIAVMNQELHALE